MNKAEILAELPRLAPEELAEVQAKLDELTGDKWLGDNLTDVDKDLLDEALADYQSNPDAGNSWEEVRARIQARISM